MGKIESPLFLDEFKIDTNISPTRFFTSTPPLWSPTKSLQNESPIFSTDINPSPMKFSESYYVEENNQMKPLKPQVMKLEGSNVFNQSNVVEKQSEEMLEKPTEVKFESKGAFVKFNNFPTIDNSNNESAKWNRNVKVEENSIHPKFEGNAFQRMNNNGSTNMQIPIHLNNNKRINGDTNQQNTSHPIHPYHFEINHPFQQSVNSSLSSNTLNPSSQMMNEKTSNLPPKFMLFEQITSSNRKMASHFPSQQQQQLNQMHSINKFNQMSQIYQHQMMMKQQNSPSHYNQQMINNLQQRSQINSHQQSINPLHQLSEESFVKFENKPFLSQSSFGGTAFSKFESNNLGTPNLSVPLNFVPFTAIPSQSNNSALIKIAPKTTAKRTKKEEKDSVPPKKKQKNTRKTEKKTPKKPKKQAPKKNKKTLTNEDNQEEFLSNEENKSIKPKFTTELNASTLEKKRSLDLQSPTFTDDGHLKNRVKEKKEVPDKIQCLGSSKKKGTQCKNAALLEYIGPRPLYCAEHIEEDKNTLHGKCKCPYFKTKGIYIKKESFGLISPFFFFLNR